MIWTDLGPWSPWLSFVPWRTIISLQIEVEWGQKGKCQIITALFPIKVKHL